MDSDISITPSRRALLRAGGLGALTLLAGCITGSADPTGPSSPSPTPSTSPSPTPTPEPPGSDDLPGGDDSAGTRPSGTGGPAVSLASVDPAPDLPLVPAVGMVSSVATAEAPPRLRVTLTNGGDQPLRVGEGREVLFQYVHDDRGALVLLPPAAYDAAPDCWRLDSPVVTTEEFRILDLAPRGTLIADLELYATGRDGADACLPVGEHRFEATYRVWTDDPEDDETVATWAFTVLLE